MGCVVTRVVVMLYDMQGMADTAAASPWFVAEICSMAHEMLRCAAHNEDTIVS